MANNPKNILIGKIGKSIKFKDVKIATGGDACLVWYSSIARMNPEYNFYIVGPNDLSKATPDEYDYLFPNHNVFSVFDRKRDEHMWYKCIIDKLSKDNIKIDFALMMCGQVGSTNIPNFSRTKEGTYAKQLLAYSNYAGPYIYTLNQLGCPLYLISEDPRYVTINAIDFHNRERLVFTQTNAMLEPMKHIKSDTDHSRTTEKIKCVYADTEKIFLMGLDKNWRSNIDIDKKLKSTGDHLIVISNGHGTSGLNHVAGPTVNRYNTYNHWIFELLKDTKFANSKIYGKWSDDIYEQCPNIQNRLLVDLKDEIANAKYSFVYSIVPGFVTVKPWEMIATGLIPFLHPDYDPNHLLGLPDYIYLKDEQDFKDKLNELENDNDKYVSLLNDCLDCIKPEYLDGSFLNNKIFDAIGKDLGFDYEKKQGIESIFNHYDSNLIQYKNIDKSDVSEIKELKLF